MSIKARIWWEDSTGSYVLSSMYNTKLVEGLKLLIPSGDRMWDQQTKFWHFSEQYGEMVRKLCESSLGPGTVSFTSKQVSQQYQQAQQQQRASLSPNAQTTDACINEFFSLLSYDAARKAYLVSAQSLHPDKQGGDGQKMSRLNELWQRLEKEVFKR